MASGKLTATKYTTDNIGGRITTRSIIYEIVGIPGRQSLAEEYTLRIESEPGGGKRTATVTSFDPEASALFSSAYASQVAAASAPPENASPSASSDVVIESPTALSRGLSASGALLPPMPTSLPPGPVQSSSSSTEQTSTGTELPVSASGVVSTPASVPALRKNSNLSSGAAAGIGVGCFFAGILAAALAAFFLLARNRKRHRQYDRAAAYDEKEQSPMTIDTPTQKAPSVTLAALPPASAAAVIEDALPRPADDETIRAAFASLRTQVNNHVLSFYRTNPSQEQVAPGALSTALAGSGVSAENAQALLRDHRTRTAAMRFAIAWTAISRMQGSENGGPTFLPGQVASCQDLFSRSGGDSYDEARGAFLSKWRSITAYLLSPAIHHAHDHGAEGDVEDDDAHSDSKAQRRKVADAVVAADSVLWVYAKGQDAGERLRNLEGIMQRAERLAFMLFAQPGEFRFDWERPEESIVVFPGLVRAGDEHGQELMGLVTVLEREVIHV